MPRPWCRPLRQGEGIRGVDIAFGDSVGDGVGWYGFDETGDGVALSLFSLRQALGRFAAFERAACGWNVGLVDEPDGQIDTQPCLAKAINYILRCWDTFACFLVMVGFA